VLFKTPSVAVAPHRRPGCNPTTDLTQPQYPNCLLPQRVRIIPQAAGLVTMRNTPSLVDAMNGLPPFFGVRWLCPIGYGYTAASSASPTPIAGLLSLTSRRSNDNFWQNRASTSDITGAGNRTAVAAERWSAAADVESGG